MVVRRIRALLVLLAVLGALLAVSAARAEVVTAQDSAGRAIRFDVRSAVNVDWFADILRRAAHGDEIARVTIRIVDAGAIRSHCGPGAAGCYQGGAAGGVIVVPGVESSETRHTLLHEYAHHLDASTPVSGAREPNGSPRWWSARGMESLLAEGLVEKDYSLGWTRAIGEIFAEDYAQMHERFPYKIGWLEPPAGAVAEALRADLTGLPAAPVSRPVEIVRRGVIQPGETRTLPFGLLGPGRRVTFTVTLGPAGQAESGRAGRMEIRCAGRTFRKIIGAAGSRSTLDRAGLGPAQCRVALVSTSTGPQAYVATLRLAVAS
ncbi:MAG: hypothetical protein ACKVUT_05025 [Gaiella sp.]